MTKVYKIYKDGQEINSIVADEAFASTYCEKNGYTYEEDIRPEPEPEVEPTTEEILNAMLGVE